MDRWFSLTIRAKFYFLFFSFIPEFLLFVEAQLHDKYKHQFSNKIVKYIHTSNMQWWKWGMFLTVAIKKCLFLFFFFSYTNVYIYITYKETEIKLLLDYQITFLKTENILSLFTSSSLIFKNVIVLIIWRKKLRLSTKNSPWYNEIHYVQVSAARVSFHCMARHVWPGTVLLYLSGDTLTRSTCRAQSNARFSIVLEGV